MTKERVYPVLPRVFGNLEADQDLEEILHAYADPLLDEIDALKTGLEIIDSQFKAEQNENDTLRAIIANSELHLANCQREMGELRAIIKEMKAEDKKLFLESIELRGTIERQRGVMRDALHCVEDYMADIEDYEDKSSTDFVVSVITALQAELEKK